MGGEIIAEKFALLKARGSNGVSFTHIVEDTLLGQRAVVKISDKLDEVGLDYLKTINLVGESRVPGLLVPFEGGILEEDMGYYLAFPELGEPSLENYLRMGAPLACRDVLGIARDILHILEALHEAGFCHLFLNTRNVFYRPRGKITLKDPALKRDYFHPFLELVASPDFSYFSPGVMDGEPPGSEADLYALGRLIERMLEQAADTGSSNEEQVARWLARRCRSAGSGGEISGAAEIRHELERSQETVVHTSSGEVSARRSPNEVERTLRRSHLSHGRRPPRHSSQGKSRAVRTAITLVLVILVLCGAAAAYFFTVGGEGTPALARGGGSVAGEKVSRQAIREIRENPAAVQPEGGGQDAGDKPEAGESENPVEETACAGGDSGALKEALSQPQAAPAAAVSPAPPVASFTLSPPEGQSPLQVHIDASGSYDPDGSIVSYAWSCGGSAKSFYHVFESNVIPAVVPVTLTVTDDGGHNAQATRYVTLY